MKSNKDKVRDLKLIEWYNANFPPIDLNKNYRDVIDLVNEIKKLRKKLNHEK